MKRLLGVALVLLVAAGSAMAQPYPAKPVKLIVPFPPGGNTDIVGRLIAQKLSGGLGQQFYVENRGGAGGTIGAEAAAKSPAMQSALRYDPVKGFAPISTLANAPVVVLVRGDLPVNSLRELIDLAKAKPGQLKYGSAGTGHFVHLAGEMFEGAAGVDLFHVPFKGVAAALIDVLGGRIELMFDAAAQYEPHLKSGKLRALAVAHEAGLPNYELASWFGLLAPVGTPADIVQRVNAEVLKALATPEATATLQKLGLEAGGSSPQQYAAMIVQDAARWRQVVKAAGIKLD
jgi:tripartite-type tricarboxylate transporter receptor subunit TctC